MKRFNFKFLYIFLMMAIISISCEDEDVLDDNPLLTERLVYISDVTPVSVSEATNSSTSADGEISNSLNTLDITVQRSGRDVSQEVTVSLDISVVYTMTTNFFNEGDDASGTIIVPGDNPEITIPSGAYEASQKIRIVNDDLSTGDRLLTASISSVSGDYAIGFPNENESRTSIEITVQDDDCPIDIVAWEGNYTMVSIIRPSDGLDLCGFGTCTDTGVITVDTTDPTGTSLILTLPSGFADPLELQMITCPQEVAIKNSTDILGSFGSFNWSQNIEDDGPNLGSYDPDTFRLTFWGGLDTPGNGYEVVLTKD